MSLTTDKQEHFHHSYLPKWPQKQIALASAQSSSELDTDQGDMIDKTT